MYRGIWIEVPTQFRIISSLPVANNSVRSGYDSVVLFPPQAAAALEF